MTGDFLCVVPSKERAVEIVEYRKLRSAYEDLLFHHPPQLDDNKEIENNQSENNIEKEMKKFPSKFDKEKIDEKKVKKKINQNNDMMEEEDIVKVVLKADQTASLEALLDGLSSLTINCKEKSNIYKQMEVVHCGVGPLTQGDLTYASLNDCAVYMFNVNLDGTVQRIINNAVNSHHVSANEARKRYEKSKIQIYTYKIIYDLFGEIEQRLRKFPDKPELYQLDEE